METEITQLADAVATVEDEQKYMWARERASRDSECCGRICVPSHAEPLTACCPLQPTRAQTRASFGSQFSKRQSSSAWRSGRSTSCARSLRKRGDSEKRLRSASCCARRESSVAADLAQLPVRLPFCATIEPWLELSSSWHSVTQAGNSFTIVSSVQWKVQGAR